MANHRLYGLQVQPWRIVCECGKKYKAMVSYLQHVERENRKDDITGEVTGTRR